MADKTARTARKAGSSGRRYSQHRIGEVPSSTAKRQTVLVEIENLRFREWDTPDGFASSALFQERLACGIYVLVFANGEEYVGQTVNFPMRFSTHRRRWNDITSVRFAEVLNADLNEAERAVIRQRSAAGVYLRNRSLLAQPLGSSPFDLIVDREVQAAWLQVTAADDEPVEIDDQRTLIAQRRIRTRARLDELRTHPRFEDVLESVASYVAFVIPWPHETEGMQWTLTALPSTSRGRDNRRLATLSIQNVEVLVLGEGREPNGEWEPYTFMNTAVMPNVPSELAHVLDEVEGYRSAGIVHQFNAAGHDVVGELLGIPEVRLAARSLALGQLRKGRSVLSRHHNDAFADEVFAKIGQWAERMSEHVQPRQ